MRSSGNHEGGRLEDRAHGNYVKREKKRDMWTLVERMINKAERRSGLIRTCG